MWTLFDVMHFNSLLYPDIHKSVEIWFPAMLSVMGTGDLETSKDPTSNVHRWLPMDPIMRITLQQQQERQPNLAKPLAEPIRPYLGVRGSLLEVPKRESHELRPRPSGRHPKRCRGPTWSSREAALSTRAGCLAAAWGPTKEPRSTGGIPSVGF